jgi:hypothetical protein
VTTQVPAIATEPGAAEEPAGPHDAASAVSEWLFRAAVAVAVFPILFAGIRAAADGWFPTTDDGHVAIRSHDVFTLNPPLVGPWSSASAWTHRDVALPGPFEDYVLAVPVRLFGLAAGTWVGVALLHAIAIMVAGWLVRRRSGPVVGAVAMVFVAFLCWSLGAGTLVDPWQPYVPLFVFILFLVGAWSLCDRDLVALPVLAVTGSFLVQTHPSYVLLVILIGVASCGAVWWALRRTAGSASTRRFRSGVTRWSLASAAIGLCCWIPPLYQQITASHGNLGELARALRVAPPGQLTFLQSVRVVASKVVVPPFWLPPSWRSHSFGYFGPRTGLVAAVTALVVATALLAFLTRDALRRGDHTSVAMVVPAGAGVLAAILTAWRAPSPMGFSAAYVRWLWPLGMFVWFVVACMLIRRQVFFRRSVVIAGASVLVAATVGAITTVAWPSGSPLSPRWAAEASDHLIRQALPELRRHHDLVVRLDPSPGVLQVEPGVTAELVVHGVPFRVEGSRRTLTLGSARAAEAERPATALWVVGTPVAPRGSHAVAGFDGLFRSESNELARLTRRLSAALTVNGGVRLTVLGRQMIGGVSLLQYAWNAVEPFAGRPDELIQSPLFAGLAGNDFHGRRVFDVGAMDSRSLTRWGELASRRAQQSVFLFLGPA